MRKLLRKFFFLFYKPYAIFLISKHNTYHYKNLSLQIPKGVFHPGLFFSTHFLIREIETLDLSGRKFLELGCGSGLISLVAASKGAEVTSSDINPLAVNNASSNAVANNLQIRTVVSDLFQNLRNESFDYIIINPPYFKRNPKTDSDKAWFAGEELEYFQKLFQQLANHFTPTTICLMVLSEDCDTKEIENLASANNLKLNLRKKETIWFEENFIYEIQTHKDSLNEMSC